MTEKEIEIFNEFKEFLEAFNDGDYSSGDAMETLEYFYDKLNDN